MDCLGPLSLSDCQWKHPTWLISGGEYQSLMQPLSLINESEDTNLQYGCLIPRKVNELTEKDILRLLQKFPSEANQISALLVIFYWFAGQKLMDITSLRDLSINANKFAPVHPIFLRQLIYANYLSSDIDNGSLIAQSLEDHPHRWWMIADAYGESQGSTTMRPVDYYKMSTTIEPKPDINIIEDQQILRGAYQTAFNKVRRNRVYAFKSIVLGYYISQFLKRAAGDLQSKK